MIGHVRKKKRALYNRFAVVNATKCRLPGESHAGVCKLVLPLLSCLHVLQLEHWGCPCSRMRRENGFPKKVPLNWWWFPCEAADGYVHG